MGRNIQVGAQAAGHAIQSIWAQLLSYATAGANYLKVQAMVHGPALRDMCGKGISSASAFVVKNQMVIGAFAAGYLLNRAVSYFTASAPVVPPAATGPEVTPPASLTGGELPEMDVV